MSRSGKVLGVLAAIIVPLLPLLVCADGLRWSGMLYQLGGLATVVWGLNERPEAFGLSTRWDDARQWLARVRDRILRRPQIISPDLFTNGESFGQAEVHGYSDLDISGSTAQQLAAIKNRLRSVTDAVVAADKKLNKLEKETTVGLERERYEREKAVTELKRQAVNAALGNTGLDLLGVVLVGLGIVLSTFAS